MRYVIALAVVLLALLSVPSVNFSQGGQMESSRGVEGGGITVPGWTGKIDAKEELAGMTLLSAKLAKEVTACTSPLVQPSRTGIRKTKRLAITRSKRRLRNRNT